MLFSIRTKKLKTTKPTDLRFRRLVVKIEVCVNEFMLRAEEPSSARIFSRTQAHNPNANLLIVRL